MKRESRSRTTLRTTGARPQRPTKGGWPPLSGGYGYDELPRELLRDLAARAGGHLVHTMSGSAFAIPLSREAGLMTVVRSAGYEVCRDDGLIGSMSAVSY
jgi:hypothetical protein